MLVNIFENMFLTSAYHYDMDIPRCIYPWPHFKNYFPISSII